MELIAHRVNTIEELKRLDCRYGVELDLRDQLDGKIYISHNPFEPGDYFEDYIKGYRHGTMILNVKSERIEHKCLQILRGSGITDYFFLDSSFPMIKLLSDMGEKNFALRFSEFEGIDTIVRMQGKVKWIWVDCFQNFPLTGDIYQKMKEMGYRICIVSPELQGQPEKIERYRSILETEGIQPDAVCAKTYSFIKWEPLQKNSLERRKR